MNDEDLKEVKKSMMERPELFEDDLGGRNIGDLTLRDFDFEGFLIPNIKLRRMLMELGFKEDKENGRVYIESDNPILDKVPTILEDDGMGYGANNGPLTGCEVDNDGKVKLWF